MPDPITAAIIQHPPVFLNLERSVERAVALARQAAEAGARLVVFPETWLPGYPVWLDEAPKAALWDYPPAKALYRLLAENSLTVPGPHLDRLLAAARENEAYLVMGAHERDGGTLYNTTLYLAPTGDFTVHRKLTPTYTERLVWGQGDGSTLNVLETPFGTLGGLICWEHWVPLARAAMHARRETVHVAQWPWAKELHQLASRHYAFEGQCFVLVAGTVLSRADVLAGADSLGNVAPEARELLEALPGADGDLLQRGGSAVIAPDAGYLAGPLYDEPGILTATLDPARVAEGHLLLDTDGHYSRPDVFRLEVDDRPRSNVRFRSRE